MSETCRVSFQNKCEKLVHLVGFIITICHHAWSHECSVYIYIYIYIYISKYGTIHLSQLAWTGTKLSSILNYQMVPTRI